MDIEEEPFCLLRPRTASCSLSLFLRTKEGERREEQDWPSSHSLTNLASKTWEEHIRQLEKVLTIVEKANLKLKGSKCRVGAKEVTLGHTISERGIKTDPNKLRAIAALAIPTDARAVKRVVRLLSKYIRWSANFLWCINSVSNLCPPTKGKPESFWSKSIPIFDSSRFVLGSNHTEEWISCEFVMRLNSEIGTIVYWAVYKFYTEAVRCTASKLSVRFVRSDSLTSSSYYNFSQQNKIESFEFQHTFQSIIHQKISE